MSVPGEHILPVGRGLPSPRPARNCISTEIGQSCSLGIVRVVLQNDTLPRSFRHSGVIGRAFLRLARKSDTLLPGDNITVGAET